MPTETTLQRLSFIRYLYGIAVEQSRQPEPFGAASVLTFHDSVELFLQLAAESKGIRTTEINFMQYWVVLRPHLQNGELSQKEEMRRLNKIRVDLKHIGILPSKLVVESLRANTTSFFEENTPLIFGIEFGKISMTYLIQNNTVKTLLDEAGAFMEHGSRAKAIDKIALAFEELMIEYTISKFPRRRRNLFSSRFFLPRLKSSQPDSSRQLEDFAEQVKEALEELRESMVILSLGLDYQRYVRFKQLTPFVVRYSGSVHPSLPQSTEEEHAPSLAHCQFCYDFVIASAIRIQSFDFDIEV